MTAPKPAGPACMGGWCTQRNHCASHLQRHRVVVVERLCAKGKESPNWSLKPAEFTAVEPYPMGAV